MKALYQIAQRKTIHGWRKESRVLSETSSLKTLSTLLVGSQQTDNE